MRATGVAPIGVAAAGRARRQAVRSSLSLLPSERPFLTQRWTRKREVARRPRPTPRGGGGWLGVFSERGVGP